MSVTNDQVAALYAAVFNRAPDQEGLNFWVGQDNFVAIAEGFVAHPVFEAEYGEKSNLEFVQSIYENVLNGQGDAEGIDFWVNLLDSGASKGEFLASFLDAALGYEGDDADALLRQQALENKVTVGLYYTETLGEATNFPADADVDSADIVNSPVYQKAAAAIENVTADPETVEAAKAEIDREAEGNEPDTLTEGLASLAAANAELTEAEEALVELLLEAEILTDADAFDPEDLEDYADAAEVNVQNAISALASARATASDAAVQKAVTDAQADINANELGDDTISDTPSTTRYDAAGNQLVPLYYNADDAEWATQAELDADATLTGYSFAGYQVATGGTPPVDGTDTPANYGDFEATVFTARQLQQRVDSAQATLASHEANNGATLELAGELNDAIALYLAGGGDDLSGTELDDIQGAYTTVVGLINEDGTFATGFEAALVTWAEAVAAAQALITDDTAPEELDDIGGRDDAVLDLLATLDKRVELFGELGAREVAFYGELDDAPFAFDGTNFDATPTASGDSVGATLLAAEQDLETRNDRIDDLETAQQQQADLAELIGNYEDAATAVAAIEEELGYTVEQLDSGIEFATDDADLFTFDLSDFTDEDGVVTLENVIINGADSDDVLFFFGDYQLGTEGSADNNVLELFFTEVNGNAVIQVEATAFGSQTDNFVEITLSGISQDQLSFENGAVFIAEVA